MASDRAIFPRAGIDDWRRAAEREPPPFTTEGGVSIAPLQAGRTDAAPVTTVPGWKVVQRLTARDGEGAVREASAAIAGGATGIEVVFAPSAHPLSSHLPLEAARRVADGLRDFGVPDVTFRIDAGSETGAAAAAFADTARTAGAETVLAYDPVAQFAATTEPGWQRLERGPDLAGAMAAAGRMDGVRIIAIADGRIWHAAGATEVQELAAALATLVALLRNDASPSRLGVALAADNQLYPTLAKFRAMRLLLRRLAEVITVPAVTPIHAETSWRSRTRLDPRMNVLRATIGAVAAIAGGANSVTVLPHDTGTPDSQRLARNTQLIARFEASLGRVADPGAGGGAIEALTEAFAAKAWTSFQAIEAEGGIGAPVALERLTQAVAETRQRRTQRVTKGEMPLLGVNVHVADSTNIGAGMVDYPRTLLRYEPLDAEFIDLDEATA